MLGLLRRAAPLAVAALLFFTLRMSESATLVDAAEQTDVPLPAESAVQRNELAPGQGDSIKVSVSVNVGQDDNATGARLLANDALANVAISSGPQDDHADIAVDAEGNVYAVWEARGSQIQFAWRAPTRQWSAPQVVASLSSGYPGMACPKVAADGSGNLFLVWTDVRPEAGTCQEYLCDWDIWFSYRPHDGSWSAPVRVNDDVGTSPQMYPAISVDSKGNALAVWKDARASAQRARCDVYSSYRPAGGSWGPNVKINDVGQSDLGTAWNGIGLAMGPLGDAWAIWSEAWNGTGTPVRAVYRTLTGTWRPSERLCDDGLMPEICVDGQGNAYGIWSGVPAKYAYRPRNGSWTPAAPIDNSPYAWGYPTIASTEPGRAFAAWVDERSGSKRIYGKWLSNGAADVVAIPISEDTTGSSQWFPAAAGNAAGTLAVVWTDCRSETAVVYAAVQEGPTVSGRVTDSAGSPVAGVTISDGAGHTALTDANGNYSLAGLGAGTYTITPCKSGLKFSPPSTTVTVSADAVRQDFLAVTPSWTLMYYLAADNDLEAGTNRILTWHYGQLRAAGSNPQVNIVAFSDCQAADAKYLVFSPCGTITVPKGELNTGDPTTLRDFVLWAEQNYPAQHYALTIVDHGNGVHGCAVDWTDTLPNTHDSLTLKELRQALDGTAHLDIVYMNACLMGTIEVAYQLRGLTDYYVASESPAWPNPPFWYTLGYEEYFGSWNIIVPAIAESTTAEGLATAIAQSFAGFAERKLRVPSTISVVRMSQLEDLVAKTSALAGLLRINMESLHETLKAIQDPGVLQYFDTDGDGEITEKDELVDLYRFAEVVETRVVQTEIQEAARQVKAAIDAYTVYERHWNGTYSDKDGGEHYWSHANSHGVSIFFPSYRRSFYKDGWTDFTAGTIWDINNPTTRQSAAASGTVIEWGPMLVEYIAYTNPDAPDDPNPPALQSPVMPVTSLALAPGWNLVSLPLLPANPVGIRQALASIDGLYDQVSLFDAADALDPWKDYNPAPGNTSDLTEINGQLGLWVHATAPATLIVDGTASASPTIGLKAGWNLVGYPSSTARPVAEALASIGGKYDLVYAYDPANAADPWKKYNPAMPAVLNDLTKMAPGKGYWVHVTEDCTWVVP